MKVTRGRVVKSDHLNNFPFLGLIRMKRFSIRQLFIPYHAFSIVHKINTRCTVLQHKLISCEPIHVLDDIACLLCNSIQCTCQVSTKLMRQNGCIDYSHITGTIDLQIRIHDSARRYSLHRARANRMIV